MKPQGYSNGLIKSMSVFFINWKACLPDPPWGRRVNHLARAHHGSLGLPCPDFCFAVVQQRQEHEWVLMSSPSELGYPARPRNLEVSPGCLHRETKLLLQITQGVCRKADFFTLNQYPDNQLYMVLGEHARRRGQHQDWLKEATVKGNAEQTKGHLLTQFPTCKCCRNSMCFNHIRKIALLLPKSISWRCWLHNIQG